MAADTKIETVLIRGGTAKDAAKNNIVLLGKEIAIETDTFRMKLGDGKTRWNKLPYLPFSLVTEALIKAWNNGITSVQLFQNSPAYGITNLDIANWNAAAGAETDPIFIASPAYGIGALDITNWNNKADKGFAVAMAIALG